MSREFTGLSVSALAKALAAKAVSSAEVTEAYLDTISQKDAGIGAYITVTAESAMEQARKIDALRAAGEQLPLLAGIPMGYKDNICTKGVATTCASRMMEEFVPPYDAAVVEKLNAQSTVMLGKLNLDEFAMGSTCESSYFHPTRNPHDLTRVAGGSSGGSAAAVAAYEAAFALGSDTGGSIRQPASFCGVVGMKPTYGAVSRYGAVAMASSLDQIGPVTRDVRDSALVLEAISGYDGRDATSLKYDDLNFSADLEKGVKGLRIGLPSEYFSDGVSEEIKTAVRNAVNVYERLGAVITEVSLPVLEYALPAYYVISSAEASSNLSCFGGINFGYRASGFEDVDGLYKASRSEGFGQEVKRRIMLGSFVLSEGYYDAYYKKALQVRTLVRREFDRVFDTCDCILSPVTPTTAYKLGEKYGDPLEMYMGDILTVPVNIAGIPALSIPCGKDAGGMPIGMQLMGKPFSEKQLYRIAYAFESEVSA